MVKAPAQGRNIAKKLDNAHDLQITGDYLLNGVKKFTFKSMSRKSFEAFEKKFDEIRRRGLNNWDAFEEANEAIPTYKDAESFIKTRSYHRRKKRGK